MRQKHDPALKHYRIYIWVLEWKRKLLFLFFKKEIKEKLAVVKAWGQRLYMQSTGWDLYMSFRSTYHIQWLESSTQEIKNALYEDISKLHDLVWGLHLFLLSPGLINSGMVGNTIFFV